MESVTYVISLDAIDLNLLYSTYKPRQNIISLWNVNRKDLCEFQIHIRESSTAHQCIKNESTKVLKKMESIICHICNTYLPKQFLEEHNMSLKHKIYLAIAKTALKRISKRISDKSNHEKIQLNEQVYFCSNCVCVINIKEKKNHEGSLNHKHSVFLDKQLLKFLKLYSNDIEKPDRDNNNNTSGIVDKESNEMTAVNGTSKQTKFEAAITGLNLLTYLNILKDKYNMTLNVKILNKGWLEIEIDGRKLEVAASNFYGLKENSSTSSNIDCVVCDEIIYYEDIVTHIMSPKHMVRVSMPMKDIHCKREIFPLWHHCVLCNIIISNNKFHTISDAVHEKSLKDALKPVVEKSIDNSTDSPKNTVSKTFQSNTNDVTAGHSDVTSKNKHLFKIEMGRLWCLVCDVSVKETDNIETHIKLGDHIENYTLLLERNKLQIQYNNDFFCGVCNEIVVTNKELLHLNDICHKQRLQDSENNINQTLTPRYYCFVCGVTVPNCVNNIQSHKQGKRHLKNKNKKITQKR